MTRLIERAAVLEGDDRDLAAKFATAPEWWMTALNVARRSRGLTPVTIQRCTTSRATSAPAKRGPITVTSGGRKIVLPALPRHCGRIVGLVAPGLSNAVRASNDMQLLPERIAPGAWRDYLRDIKAGKAVCTLRVGHNGPTVASTADGTLTLSADIVEGLAIESEFGVAGFEAQLHRKIRVKPEAVGLSCDIEAVAFHHEQRGGHLCRVITQARLQSHVALMLPGTGASAAYVLSRVAALPDDDPATAQRVLRGLVMSVAGK